MISECDFYNNLFDDFVETKNNESEKVLWKMYKIIDLINLTSEKDTNGFMENGLRMIMLLFNHFKIESCDLSGIDMFDTTLYEKEELMSVMLKEFT